MLPTEDKVRTINNELGTETEFTRRRTLLKGCWQPFSVDVHTDSGEDALTH